MKILLFLILIAFSVSAQDYIIIRDAPDGGGSEVTVVNMTTDDSFTFYAAGYDSLDNFMGNLKADWTLTGTLDGTPQSDTVFVFSPNIALTVGVIQAQVDNISDATGTISVNPGLLCYIKIRCAPNNSPSTSCFPEYEDTGTVYVGDHLSLWAAGFDCDGNYRGDEPLSFDSLDIEYTGTLVVENWIFTEPGQGRIIVTDIDTSGIIIVDPRSPKYIQISDAPDGEGNEVRNVSMTTGDSLTLYAVGYDSSGDFIGNLKADWTLIGSLDGTPRSDSVFVFSPSVAPTSGVIVATVNNMSDATGTITVAPGEPCYIIIRGTPCNGVIIFSHNDNVCLPEYDDTTTAYIGEHLTLWAGEYDCDGNFRRDVNFLIDSTVVELTGTLKAELSTISLMFTGLGQGRVILNGTDTSGVIIVEEPTSIAKNPTPLKYELKQAYPNPFNPSTAIKFSLPKPGQVRLEVFNSIGQKVETLINRNMTAGEHKVEFNAMHLSSGVYYYRLVTANFTDVKKFILMK